jgi:hypothetical protein
LEEYDALFKSVNGKHLFSFSAILGSSSSISLSLSLARGRRAHERLLEGEEKTLANKNKKELKTVPRNLVLKLPSPNGTPASPGPARVPTLRHEILNHSVKNQPVVVAFLAQLEEVLARFRGVQVIQFQFERAEGGLEEDGRGAGRVVLRVESRFVRLLVVVVAAHSYAVRFFRVGVAIARELCLREAACFFRVLKKFTIQKL